MWHSHIMKDKKATHNKDGTLRKKGSGRKKGSNSFVRVTFSQLKDFIGEKTPMMVSRVWLENIGITENSSEIVVPKINLTQKDLTEDDSSDNILFSVKKFD